MEPTTINAQKLKAKSNMVGCTLPVLSYQSAPSRNGSAITYGEGRIEVAL
jgi:hypothetical protein